MYNRRGILWNLFTPSGIRHGVESCGLVESRCGLVASILPRWNTSCRMAKLSRLFVLASRFAYLSNFRL